MLNFPVMLARASLGGALERTTLGRLAAYMSIPITDVTEAFDNADWTAPSAGSFTITINGGRLRIVNAASATTKMPRLNAIGNLTNGFVYSTCNSATAGLGIGVALRVADEADPNDAIALQIPAGVSGTEQLLERVGGSIIQTDATGSINRTLPVSSSIYVSGAVAKSYNYNASDERELSGIGYTTAGRAGLYYSSSSANAVEYLSFFYMSSHLITVNGPTSFNWRVDILDNADSVMASGTAVSGVATVDVFAERLIPTSMYKVRIVNTDTATTLFTETPVERVWAGDIWSFGI